MKTDFIAMMKDKLSPFTVGICLLVVVGGIMLIPLDDSLSGLGLSDFQVEYLGLSMKMGSLLIFALWAIYKSGLSDLAGLTMQRKWSNKLLNLIPAYLILIGMVSIQYDRLHQVELINMLLLIVACLLVGFAEEFLFRGFLQGIFINRNRNDTSKLRGAVIFPALFFGFSHLINLTQNDNIPQVISQVIYASFIGLFFGVVLLKTNKIVPLAITHGLINLVFLFNSLPGLIDTSETEIVQLDFVDQVAAAIPGIIIFLPLLIVGLIILRRINGFNLTK